MSKFLDTIDKLNVPNPTVVMRNGMSPLTMTATWNVEDQRGNRGYLGTRYKLAVELGAYVVQPNNHYGVGMARGQIRKLMAHEIYGEFDEIERRLIELQMKLYNVPDKEAQYMASDLGFILIAFNKARS